MVKNSNWHTKITCKVKIHDIKEGESWTLTIKANKQKCSKNKAKHNYQSTKTKRSKSIITRNIKQSNTSRKLKIYTWHSSKITVVKSERLPPGARNQRWQFGVKLSWAVWFGSNLGF